MAAPLTQTPEITHLLYPRVENPADADGLAWVFKNKEEFVPYYFKFPELSTTDVRAKITYTGLCHSDIMTGREHWGPCNFPLCPGHEVVGEITHVGADVKNVKVGDQVAVGPIRNHCHDCSYCKQQADNLCTGMDGSEKFLYGLYFGGYATHIQINYEHVFQIPEGMDASNIPPILCAGITVYAPMKRWIKEEAGAKVGVIGIGGLGHLAVQYGKAMGHHVVAFTTSADKVDYIKKLGAAEVIVVDKELKELAKHTNKVQYLVNTLPISSPDILEGYLQTLAPNGVLIQVGMPNANEKFSISFYTLILKQISIAGSIVASIKDTQDCLNFSHKHGVKVEVEKFDFANFPKALDRLENGRPVFRCVVNVEDYAKAHFPK